MRGKSYFEVTHEGNKMKEVYVITSEYYDHSGFEIVGIYENYDKAIVIKKALSKHGDQSKKYELIVKEMG